MSTCASMRGLAEAAVSAVTCGGAAPSPRQCDMSMGVKAERNLAMASGLPPPLPLPAAAAACPILAPPSASLFAGSPWTRSLRCAAAWERSAFRRRSCGGCWSASHTLSPTMGSSPRAACTLRRQASRPDCSVCECTRLVDTAVKPLAACRTSRPLRCSLPAESLACTHALWFCRAC